MGRRHRSMTPKRRRRVTPESLRWNTLVELGDLQPIIKAGYDCACMLRILLEESKDPGAAVRILDPELEAAVERILKRAGL